MVLVSVLIKGVPFCAYHRHHSTVTIFLGRVCEYIVNMRSVQALEIISIENYPGSFSDVNAFPMETAQHDFPPQQQIVEVLRVLVDYGMRFILPPQMPISTGCMDPRDAIAEDTFTDAG